MLLGGCTSRFDALPVLRPTVTPLPSPTPTPFPSADGVAQTYLQAWEQQNYDIMYSLLTPESHQALTLEQFKTFYNHPLTEATVTQINTQLQSLLHDSDQAAATFFVGWQTRLFGPINANNQMNLRFAAGRWGIVWQPTLILPQLGHGVRLAFLSEQPTRGNIYDFDTHALASLGKVVTVGVIPAYLEDEATVIEQLARITGAKPDRIRASIAAARPDWFVPVGQIDFETSLELDNILSNLPGVDRRAQEVRAYSNSDTMSHIIGYMGAIPAEQKQRYLDQGYRGDELVGLSGVEHWAELDLAGQRGGRLVTLSPSHEVLSQIASVEAQAGDSVYLTIDTDFQAIVEQLLGERLGAIVVLNPQTGAVYAMASYPRFKPAVFTAGFDAQAWIDLYTDENRPLVNRAAQGLYPPGSIFKIVTMSAGMNALGLQPKKTFTCTGQWDGLGRDFTKKCWLESGHGQVSLTDGLTQSCDVVFYEVGLALHKKDPALLPHWARDFGLGVATDVVGVAENWGVVPDDEWKRENLNQPLFDGDAVNSAIGQGYMLSTPLQVARLVAAVGNGGRLLRPYLIDRVVDIHGNEKTVEPEELGQLPLLSEQLDIIRKSMEAVVSGARGTARSAFEGVSFTVAGKTGTSESGQEEPHAWFAGYAPAEEPQVAIAVILEHAGEGSKEAAPLFRQVAEAFFAWQQA